MKTITKYIAGIAAGLVAIGMAVPAHAAEPNTDSAAAKAAAAVTEVSAATAQAAAGGPYFRIFYGPNCYSAGTGSRAYFGTNAGEAWINDRYNEGGAGNGQYIRNNAASVYVANGKFLLSRDGGYSYRTFSSSAGTCFNLGDYGYRNQNTNWIVRY